MTSTVTELILCFQKIPASLYLFTCRAALKLQRIALHWRSEREKTSQSTSITKNFRQCWSAPVESYRTLCNMLFGDYVMTIDSDDEVPIQSIKPKDEGVHLDMDFVFDPSVDALTETWNNASDLRDFIKTGSRPVRVPPISVRPMYASCLQIRTGTYFR